MFTGSGGGAIIEQRLTEEVFAAPRHPYTQALIAAVPPDDPAVRWEASIRDQGSGIRRRESDLTLDT
jgi:ABC-type oligopeptide transport system ATPase subunit